MLKYNYSNSVVKVVKEKNFFTKTPFLFKFLTIINMCICIPVSNIALIALKLLFNKFL